MRWTRITTIWPFNRSRTSKSRPKFPKTKTLGINNWIKSRTAVTPTRWKWIAPLMKLVVKAGPYYKYPILGALLRRLMIFTPPETSYTFGYMLNLNENLAETSQNVVLPIELMRKCIRESGYRAIMHRCICRDANHCSEYPRDLGCIFLGEGARPLVARGVAQEASVEQVLAHVDKAAGLGLIGQSLWVEIEQYIWGVRDQDMHRFLELCFCCPCCCTSLGLARAVPRDIQSRFRSVGWKAEIDSTCVDCGLCVEVCPVDAISFDEENRVGTVSAERCLGCGICASRCPESSIRLKLKDPLRDDLTDYFAESGLRLDLKR